MSVSKVRVAAVKLLTVSPAAGVTLVGVSGASGLGSVTSSVASRI